MRRTILLTLTVGLLGAGRASAQLSGTLVVANKSGASVSFIDLGLEREVARIPVGRAPHELVISPDRTTVLVGEYGPDDAHGGTVAIFDLVRARVSGRIDVGERTRPHSMTFMPDGVRAVVTRQAIDELAIVDLESKRVLRTLPTGGRESHMVRLSPDASRAHVTVRRGEETLSVVFLDEEREPVVIQTGAGAEGMAVTSDGNEVWVLDRVAGTVSLVDTSSLSVKERFESRPNANRVAILDDARAVLTNGTSGTKIVQYLNLYDVEAKSKIREVPLRGGSGVCRSLQDPRPRGARLHQRHDRRPRPDVRPGSSGLAEGSRDRPGRGATGRHGVVAAPGRRGRARERCRSGTA